MNGGHQIHPVDSILCFSFYLTHFDIMDQLFQNANQNLFRPTSFIYKRVYNLIHPTIEHSSQVFSILAYTFVYMNRYIKIREGHLFYQTKQETESDIMSIFFLSYYCSQAWLFDTPIENSVWRQSFAGFLDLESSTRIIKFLKTMDWDLEVSEDEYRQAIEYMCLLIDLMRANSFTVV